MPPQIHRHNVLDQEWSLFFSFNRNFPSSETRHFLMLSAFGNNEQNILPVANPLRSDVFQVSYGSSSAHCSEFLVRSLWALSPGVFVQTEVRLFP